MSPLLYLSLVDPLCHWYYCGCVCCCFFFNRVTRLHCELSLRVEVGTKNECKTLATVLNFGGIGWVVLTPPHNGIFK